MNFSTHTCLRCDTQFELTAEDKDFYERIDVPFPTLCPEDRLKRRMQFRNERKLHVRKCDLTGETIVGNVRPNRPYPVYHVDEWHKQEFELPYLEKYDFDRPFFDQLYELYARVPRMHKVTSGGEENCDYANHSGNSRNCYFLFNSQDDEDCMYVKFGDNCRDCVSCNNVIQCELCYECVNGKNCYNVKFSDDTENCSDSMFLRNCRSVKNSMFCYGLERKEYCFFNEQLTKEAYEEKLKEYRVDSHKSLEYLKKAWEEWSSKWPRIRHIILNSENCTGDSIYNSQNAHDCYNVIQIQDSRYILNCRDVKDSYDVYAYGMETELNYECITMAYCYNVMFSVYCIHCSFLRYSDSCWSCENCFGCIGLKNGKFCIFNKQYSEEEYNELVPKIIEHMKSTGEWGEFFPEKFSMFPYEDTIAQDYFPMDSVKKVAIVSDGALMTDTIPDLISDVDVSLAANTYFCPVEQKPFKFQKKELEFYKKIGVAVPRVSFEGRYLKRNELIPFPY